MQTFHLLLFAILSAMLLHESRADRECENNSWGCAAATCAIGDATRECCTYVFNSGNGVCEGITVTVSLKSGNMTQVPVFTYKTNDIV